MPKIVPIVEGQGEVDAVPSLLYKILHENGRYDVHVAPPKNANGSGNLTKPGGLEKFIDLCLKDTGCGAILILVDADKECPVTLALTLAERAVTLGVSCLTAVVVAKCEYEAWFLASIETIAGQTLGDRPGLPGGLTYPQDVEARVGVKGWLSDQFPSGRIYKETEDQAPMTRLLDPVRARQRSRSFRRLCHAVKEVLDAIDGGLSPVTPALP